DPDNDGRPDIFYCNGHVYPELDHIHADTTYRQPRVLYRNRGDGTFEDVSKLAGAAITTPEIGRGCAFGDINNDGNVDIVINNQNASPSLLVVTRENEYHWINFHLIGVKSNRSGIGARVRCVAGTLAQIDEVRSGGSYLSQNDLRLHFGLGEHRAVDMLEIRWPSGHIDLFRGIEANHFVQVQEGGKLTVLRHKA
ncbi:MAG: CRTAC1 family protein, partial [Edaphobacter sp.]